MDFESAMNHHFNAVSIFEKHLGDSECDRLFILSSLSLSDLFLHVRKLQDNVLHNLRQAQEIAKRLGDERNLLLIELHLGRICQFLNRIDEAMDHFTAGLEAVKRLDDEDIKIQSSEFFGFTTPSKGWGRKR